MTELGDAMDWSWEAEKMLNPLLQSHPVLISMLSFVIIWDFR
jgi:hypothetical protein